MPPSRESANIRRVFAYQSQQQMFSLHLRRSRMGGLKRRVKYDAPCLFCVTFEHSSVSPPLMRGTGPRTIQYVASPVQRLGLPRHSALGTNAHAELSDDRR